MDNSTFQLLCKSCGSKLTAKTALIGQIRNCPKCKTPVLIEQEEPSQENSSLLEGIVINEPSIAPVKTGPSLQEGLGFIENLPERLDFHNTYFVLGHDRLIAVWESGKSWQINTGHGFAPAKKCIDVIPDQGTFQLVELVFRLPSDPSTIVATAGAVPDSVNVFKISVRGALTALYKDENTILERVDCPGELSDTQKNLLLAHLRQMVMGENMQQLATLFG